MSSPARELATLTSQADGNDLAVPVIYPPVTHSASPTWFIWLKLTSYEIHNVLKPAPSNFASLSYRLGPNDKAPAIFHYINHPVQYVAVVGVVVEVNEFNAKYYLFILDDSSGETLEIVYPRPPGAPTDVTRPVNQVTQQESQLDPDEVELHRLLSGVDVGSVLNVKGHITTFRSYRQLRIERIRVLSDTNEEASFWSSMHAFHEAVLSKPWVLTEQDIANTKAQADHQLIEREAQTKRRRERTRLRAEIEERGRLKLERRWIKEEKRRAQEAEKVKAEAQEVMQRTKRREETEKSTRNVDTEKATNAQAMSRRNGRR